MCVLTRRASPPLAVLSTAALTRGTTTLLVVQLSNTYGSPTLDDINAVAHSVNKRLQEAIGEEASGDIEICISSPVCSNCGQPLPLVGLQPPKPAPLGQQGSVADALMCAVLRVWTATAAFAGCGETS